MFGFFHPLPPCPHLELIHTTKFTQPPLQHPLFQDSLRCGHHIWMLPCVSQSLILSRHNFGSQSTPPKGKLKPSPFIAQDAAGRSCSSAAPSEDFGRINSLMFEILKHLKISCCIPVKFWLVLGLSHNGNHTSKFDLVLLRLDPEILPVLFELHQR